MNYPTRNWRLFNKQFYRMQSLFDLEQKSTMNFANQLSAVSSCGGLIALAFKPNEIIQVTGKISQDEIEKKRKTVQVFYQNMAPVCNVPASLNSAINQVGWTSSGQLVVLSEDFCVYTYSISDYQFPTSTILLVENQSQPQLSKISTINNNTYVLTYCIKTNSFYVLDLQSEQILIITCPPKQKPVSAEILIDSKPGSLLYQDFNSQPRKIRNLVNGDLSVVVLMQSGALFKLKPNCVSGRDVEQLQQLKSSVSTTSQLMFDPTYQFCAVMQPQGTNFQTTNVFKPDLIQKIIDIQKMNNDEKAKLEGDMKNAYKIMQTLSFQEIDDLINSFNKNLACIVTIFDYNCEQKLTEINVQDATNLELFWIGNNSPALLYKNNNEYHVGLFNNSTSIKYKIGAQYPILKTETDGLRIVTQTGTQMLYQVLHSIKQTFHPEYASSEQAHLLEAYLNYMNGHFDSDQLTRNLQERNQDLQHLLMQAIQSAESESEQYSEMLYDSVRYFKLLTSDQQKHNSLAESIQDFSIRRAADCSYRYVSGSFQPVLKAVIEGKPVQLLYKNGEIIDIYWDRAVFDSTSGSPGDQFDIKQLITDQYVLSKKLHGCVSLLQKNNFYTSVQQLKQAGIQNVIQQLFSVQKHAAAVSISRLFELNQEPIVIDYVLQLIQKSPQSTDKELEQKILQKKLLVSSLPLRTVALAVVSKGRNRLARMLLEREPSTEAKVQLNLKIGDYASAFKQALRGGEPNLAHQALQLATEDTNGLRQMVQLINQDFSVLRIFFQANRILKPDLLYSLGTSSQPNNYIFIAEAQYRKARASKNVKQAQSFLEECQITTKLAKERHIQLQKAQKKGEVDFELKTESDLEKIKAKTDDLLSETEQIDGQKIIETENKFMHISLLQNDFQDILQAEIDLLKQQKELSEQFKKNLQGLSVFDTLVFLYTKQMQSDYDKEARRGAEDLQPGCQREIDSFIKALNVSQEIQLSATLKAITTNSNYYSNLTTLNKQFKKPDPHVIFKIAKQLNAVQTAVQFIKEIENDAQKFRLFLQLRQDTECVSIFRKIGAEKLKEIHGEFYGQSGAQAVIQRLLVELDMTTLSGKTK
ncbi:Conserved_hypothetical protein [Hexamita inflata]|uniref:Uncharacterized protein n=1 Tax=Hexamita inflata TaxID=28002 RepID=A0AA86P610_9EUKA|nr:Conserved hypothetical protein [Hexamita inflata]